MERGRARVGDFVVVGHRRAGRGEARDARALDNGDRTGRRTNGGHVGNGQRGRSRHRWATGRGATSGAGVMDPAAGHVTGRGGVGGAALLRGAGGQRRVRTDNRRQTDHRVGDGNAMERGRARVGDFVVVGHRRASRGEARDTRALDNGDRRRSFPR